MYIESHPFYRAKSQKKDVEKGASNSVGDNNLERSNITLLRLRYSNKL
jgi:hypothetical protein